MIVCVLKSGEEYGSAHVARLFYHVVDHTNEPFLCLTDMLGEVLDLDLGIIVRPLLHNWPGWWSKIELFRIRGPVLYLDLDVNILGDLRPLTYLSNRRKFIVARSTSPGNHRINSSIMGWHKDVSSLYEAFKRSPYTYMARDEADDGRWGDQAFIEDHCPRWDYWQDLLPENVICFKHEALQGKSLDNCRVLVSGGKPRPWETGGADEWLKFRR